MSFMNFVHTDYPERFRITNFDKWMYNIINMPTMDIMAFVDEKLFDDFEKMAEYAAMCPVDRMAYDANEKAYRDLMGQLEYATMEGEERGRTEATHEMILKMHEQGISLDTIAVVTGLQVSDVRTIISAEK